MDKFINEYLNLLGKLPTDIAKKKHGVTPIITYYELFKSLLNTNSLVEASIYLKIEDKTLQRLLKKILPEINIMGGKWKSHILYSIGYKECTKCRKVLPIQDFYLSKGEYSSNCKECICTTRNTSEYKNKHNEYSRLHYNENKAYYISKSIQYKYKRKLATVPWANLDKINEIYKTCPKGWHVDHIIPLNGDTVSGLHVEYNLQHLSPEDNLKKSNMVVVV